MTNVNTTPWRSDSKAVDVNASTESPTPVMELIAASDIISTANHVYALFAAVGFVSGCFLLYSFAYTHRAQRRLAWFDCLLWVFCGLQLLLVLLSLYNVVHRPHSLQTSVLGCAALSFTVNTTYLCGLFILALMAYVLALDPPSNTLLRRPGVCVAVVVFTSTLISVLLAAIRGPGDGLHQNTDCFMDPLHAGVYAVAKLCLAFLIPYVLKLGLVVCGCVRQSKSNRRFLSGSEEGPVFLAVTGVSLLCHLFYMVVLVRGAQLQEGELSNRQRAFVSVAELVFFSASSGSLIIVPLMHRPSRERIGGLLRRLSDCCTRSVHTQANRNIITPHIEITDTLQDIES
ncbi:uncharacterized protein LOC133655007 [Entelurus aequoreus]|uniref:uncharacterized protein LOC133655007 n=1 Tax=Entelurus aequoreus TaxID=161455 RepID=UPI002B1D0254|nr:uncharacterized protein LOC133655007 [Entelurus aequoreus]